MSPVPQQRSGRAAGLDLNQTTCRFQRRCRPKLCVVQEIAAAGDATKKVIDSRGALVAEARKIHRSPVQLAPLAEAGGKAEKFLCTGVERFAS